MSGELQQGEILTFYSYKGGTGRSMSLANVACILAKQNSTNKGVLMIDWDLEAPGLHRFFQNRFKHLLEKTGSFKVDIDKKLGLIDLFYKFNEQTPTSKPENFNDAEIRARKCMDAVCFEDYIMATDNHFRLKRRI